MDMKLINASIAGLQPSSSLAMMEQARAMKAQGADLIDLSCGEPDFDSPKPVVERAVEELRGGNTHYTGARGLPALRGRIARELSRYGVRREADEILVTPGAKYAIYLAVRCLLNPGDEALYLEPGWVSYRDIIRAAGGVPVALPLSPGDGYRISEAALEAKAGPKTRLLIVNSPNNPTGRMLTREEAGAIAAVARRHGLFVIADEIYAELRYDGEEHISLGADESIAERVVTVNGFSKFAAMTGWRIGYLAAAGELLKYMLLLHQHSISCVSPFVQEAALTAFDCGEHTLAMRREYQARRDLFIPALNGIPGVQAQMPQGAFYAWTRFDRRAFRAEVEDIGRFLLEKAGVVGVPGLGYGAAYGDFVRFSIAAGREELQRAAARIRAAMEG